jgi:hypothetical protein
MRIEKELKGTDLEELTKIKKSTRFLENQNIAKASLEVEIDGKVVKYQYIEHSGRGRKIEGAKGSPVGRDIKDNEFFDTEFQTSRAKDSESKIIELMNEDIADALTNGKKVTVNKVTIKTTYDPCNVCKKELLLFQQRFNAKITVERPFFIDEKRAYLHERDFQKVTDSRIDYENIDDLLDQVSEYKFHSEIYY